MKIYVTTQFINWLANDDTFEDRIVNHQRENETDRHYYAVFNNLDAVLTVAYSDDDKIVLMNTEFAERKLSEYIDYLECNR